MGKLDTPPSCYLALTILLAFMMLFAYQYAAHAHTPPSDFDSIYAFSDSLTDTGNSLLYQQSISVDAPEGHLPYGETFFHKPTGRLSDGRLVVDFLAKKVRAPHFLLPYLGLNKSKVNDETQSLVNFAVGGATAQNVDYLNATYNISVFIPYSIDKQLQNVDYLNATYNISVFIPYSIDKQLQWFSTLPISKDKEAFSKALVYFGQIGGNDYNRALENGFSIDDIILEFVPNVIKVIKKALEFLIGSGAKYLVVEGGYPIGCPPVYTRLLFINATRDKYGCVEDLHKLNDIHDKLLKELVQDFGTKYDKDVHIIFFDQLKAYAQILKHPSHYGFTNTTDPCFDTLHTTNLTSVEACPKPSTYVSWDGFHFNEATHNVLLNLFYTKGFVAPYPNFLTLI